MIGLEYRSETVFKANSPIPNPKLITFPRSDSLEIHADYLPHPDFPTDHPSHIGTYTLNNITKPASNEPANVKVKVKLDINGIFSVEEAHLVEVLPPSPDSPMEADKKSEKTETTEAAGKKEDKPEEKGEEKGDKEKKEDDKADKTEKKEEKEKRKTKRTELHLTSRILGVPSKDLQGLIENELKMIASDQLAIETAESKNALESYILTTRSSLTSELNDFATEQEKAPLLKLLDDAENWLYGDGEDVTKSAYTGKLDELRKRGDPIALRAREWELRPEATKALVDAIAYWQEEASSTAEKYEHIDKADKDKILAEVENARNWLLQVKSKQEPLPKTANPAYLSADAIARKNNLEKFARPILSKPKPKPKPAEPKPAAEPKPNTTPTTEQPTSPSTENPETPQQPDTPSTTEPEISSPKPDPSTMEVD